MNEMVLVKPFCRERSKAERLSYILDKGLSGYQYDTITTSDEFESAALAGKKLIFAISLGESGINLEYYGILKKIRMSPNCLEGCVAGLVVDGNSEFFTKSIARDLTFSANRAGCTFVGKPLVEATRDLKNFHIIAKNLNADPLEAYAVSTEQLIRRVAEFQMTGRKTPNLLVLHAGNEETSNTIGLWKMVKGYLSNCRIEEISLHGGGIYDCVGCPYTACLHFGQQSSCFYGGVITEQVYPAVLACDGLVMLCPNYNDAVSANIAAFINRLTALYRAHPLSDKKLFAIIVSGYSGGELVAQQLISALCMNKSFVLPSRFALLQTANDPGDILKIDSVEDAAWNYAQNILKQVQK